MLLNNLLYLYGALKSNYVHNYLHMFIYVRYNVDIKRISRDSYYYIYWTLVSKIYKFLHTRI